MCFIIFNKDVKGPTQYAKRDEYTRVTTDQNLLKDRFSNEKWSTVLNTTDIDESTDNFIYIFNSHVVNCTSVENVKIKSKYRIIKPWITFGLIRSIREKQKLFNLCKKYPSDVQLKIKYSKYRKMLDKLIKITKIKFYKNKIKQSGTNAKQLWSVITEILECNKKNRMWTLWFTKVRVFM
jgi:hypothetical protein